MDADDDDSARQKSRTTCQTLTAVLGNVLEWYDFALFGYFSDVIADVFFPPQTGNNALIQSFAIFGGAFLMRPVGGLTIGYIGDTQGRKIALTISLFLMAFPTFLMGCLPSYEQVGSISTFLLLVVRMLQGLSVGGQLPASLIYTLENNDKRYWGLYGSYVLVAANVGTQLGNIVGATTREVLTKEQLYSWGWRVPFLSGIIIAFAAVYLKYNGDEINPRSADDGLTPENPIKIAFSSKENRRALLSVMLASMLWGAGFYVTFVWMAIYMHSLMENPIEKAFWINALTLTFGIIFALPVAGHASDDFGRKACLIAVVGPIGILIINQGILIGVFFAQLSIGICLSIYAGPLLAWIAESFPPEVRLTSASLGYDLAHATVAGFSPLMATLFVDRIGVRSPAAFYPFFAVFSMLGLYIAPKTYSFENGSNTSLTQENCDVNDLSLDVEKEKKSLTDLPSVI